MQFVKGRRGFVPQDTERDILTVCFTQTESSLLWFPFDLNHSAKKLLKKEETSME